MTAPAINWTHGATVLAALALATPVLADPVATISGIATRARDGDGVLFGAVEVRLRAVAAPEDNSRSPRSPEGRAATAALDAMVRGQWIVCELDGTVATYGREVGVCFDDGVDVGREMVLRGLALACSAFGDDYRDEQATAERNGSTLSMAYALPAYCEVP